MSKQIVLSHNNRSLVKSMRPQGHSKKLIQKGVRAIASSGLDASKVITSGALTTNWMKIITRLGQEATSAYAKYVLGDQVRVNALRLATAKGGYGLAHMVKSGKIFKVGKQIAEHHVRMYKAAGATQYLCKFSYRHRNAVDGFVCASGAMSLADAANLSMTLTRIIFSASDVYSAGVQWVRSFQSFYRTYRAFKNGRKQNAAMGTMYSTVLLLYTIINSLIILLFIFGNPEYNTNLPTTTAYEQAQFYMGVKSLMTFVVRQFKSSRMILRALPASASRSRSISRTQSRQRLGASPLRIANTSASPLSASRNGSMKLLMNRSPKSSSGSKRRTKPIRTLPPRTRSGPRSSSNKKMIRSPVTGRMILENGPTARKLRKAGKL